MAQGVDDGGCDKDFITGAINCRVSCGDMAAACLLVLFTAPIVLLFCIRF
jgi:hypothetical protein